MAGGATPKTTEKEKYYCSSDIGIPFIRVQNLSPEGLVLDNCKHINKETHNGFLARSKVKSGDLLVKITGVGRMAVSSVAPENFEGNINQHMVVIKTQSVKISNLLAAFLNSDIGEKLASRRSTGGTRPALDYKALRSIPIICNEKILEIMNIAYQKKSDMEQQASALLDGINNYLLSELGITLPKQNDNTIESRMFICESNNVIGGRFDPKKHSKFYKNIFNAIQNSNLDKKPLKDLIVHSAAGNWGIDENCNVEGYTKCLVIRATEFDNKYNLNLNNSRTKIRNISDLTLAKMNIRANDILIEKSGGSENQPVGRVTFLSEQLLLENTIAYSNFIHKITIDKTQISSYFLFEYLRLMHNIKITEVMQNQTNGIRNLIMQEYFNQIILIPPKEKQIAIVKHIQKTKERARQLEIEAQSILENAKNIVVKILLAGDKNET